MKEVLFYISHILDKKQKSRLTIVFLATLLGSALELVGVAVILPVIEVIQEPAVIERRWYLKWCYDRFGFTDTTNFILAMLIVVVVFYIFKNLMIVAMNDLQYRFTYNNSRRVSRKLYRSFIYQPYIYHVNHSYSFMLNTITTDCTKSFECITQILHLFTEGTVALLFLIYLLIKDKTITIAMTCALLFISCIFLFGTKRRANKLGKEIWNGGIKQYDIVNQSFGGIKEVKISDKEEHFTVEYNKVYSKLSKNMLQGKILEILPRSIMEAGCIAALMSAVAFKVYRGVPLSYFLPVLSLFAVAFVRLMPSFSRVTNAITALNLHKAHLKPVYEAITELEKFEKTENYMHTEATSIPFEREIRLENVTYRYPGGERNIVDDVSLTIPKNKSVAFVGPSGEGKTTLADVILGLLTPDCGHIYVDDADISEHMHAWHSLIGYIPQNIYLTNGDILHNVAFGYGDDEIDTDRVIEALKEAQIYDFIMTLPDGLKTEVGDRGVRLSGGQRQRIGIARALYGNPQFLVLDEATSALDTETESAVMDAIQLLQGQKTMLIIAHRLTTIEKCDYKYRIKSGKIYDESEQK